jgi:hypothetical protein
LPGQLGDYAADLEEHAANKVQGRFFCLARSPKQIKVERIDSNTNRILGERIVA